MSLGLIKPGLSAATGIFHPSLRDPRTGLPLEAVGVGKSGRVWWPVIGGAEEEGEETEEEDEEKEGEEDDDVPGLKARIKALEEEKERHYKGKKTAQAELEELRKFKQSKEEEGLSEVEKAQKAAQAASARETEQGEELQKLRRERAFLLANDVEWHDREDVLRAIEWAEVEVSSDGIVDQKSLKAELKRLAKAKPWLVKKSVSDGDEKDDDEGGKTSSSPMNGKKSKGKGGPSREELSRRFPALRQGR